MIQKEKTIKGFSLIEVMIVVAILGILSAVAVPAYNSYIEVSKVKECKDEIAVIELFQSMNHAANLTYFAGDGTAAIAAASNNEYIPSSTFAAGTADCTIAIVAGPDGIATQYKIVGTGVNDLDGKGEVVVKQNY